MKRLLLAVAALVLLTGCGGGDGRASATKDVALPDATLTSLRPGGASVDLGELKGPAVVNLWASWCGPCREEMPIYERFHRAHDDVTVIGVNAMDRRPDKARQVAKQTGVSYPLVVDADESLKAIGLPKLLLVDRRGRVAWSEYVEIKSLAQLDRLVSQHLGVTS